MTAPCIYAQWRPTTWSQYTTGNPDWMCALSPGMRCYRCPELCHVRVSPATCPDREDEREEGT